MIPAHRASSVYSGRGGPGWDIIEPVCAAQVALWAEESGGPTSTTEPCSVSCYQTVGRVTPPSSCASV